MFTSKIKVLMKKKEITIRELAILTGLSSATLTKARSDSGIAECRLSTLKRIAEPLEVKVKELFEEVDTKTDDSQPTHRPIITPKRTARYRAIHGIQTEEEKKRMLKMRGKVRAGGSGG